MLAGERVTFQRADLRISSNVRRPPPITADNATLTPYPSTPPPLGAAHPAHPFTGVNGPCVSALLGAEPMLIGSWTVNVVPRPGVEATSIVPPCSRTIF